MVCVVRNSRLKLSQGQIFWRETGQGEAIAFIHRECEDGSQWSKFLDEFSETHHCFAPDLIGFGDSEHPEIPYSIQWQSEILEEFFENLRLKNIYLVGDSLGAWIASRYALNYPERVKGLILLSPIGVDAKHNPHYFLEKLLLARFPILPWLLRLFAPIATIFGLKKTILEILEYREKLLLSPATCRLLFQRKHPEIQSEYLNLQLAQIKVPTLILYREKEVDVRMNQVHLYAKSIPKAALKAIAKSDEAIAAIQDWLKEH